MTGLETKVEQLLDAASNGNARFWDHASIERSRVSLGTHTVEVRVIPSLWHRPPDYTVGCGMCTMPPHLELVGPTGTSKWSQNFRVTVNQYPYLEHQLIAIDRNHRQQTPPLAVLSLTNLLNEINFTGFAHQTLGSGASYPDHSHFALFREQIPLFAAEFETRLTNSGSLVQVARLPHLVLRFSGGRSKRYLGAGIQFLDSMGLSYNIYGDRVGRIYLLPRSAEASEALGMKVGLSLPAGLLNVYERPKPEEPQPEWTARMRRLAAHASAQHLQVGLGETCVLSGNTGLLSQLLTHLQSAQ